MDKITKDTSVEEVLEKSSEAIRVFIRHNIPCLVCGEPFWGSVEELATKYKVDVNVLLKELNDLLNNT